MSRRDYDRGFEDGRGGSLVAVIMGALSGALFTGLAWALVHFL